MEASFHPIYGQVYTVIDQIGKGGFEGITVHRAQRKRGSKQIVAVKVPREHNTACRFLSSRFSAFTGG